MARGKRLSELAASVGGRLQAGSDDPLISDVSHDSRRSAPGVLFVAIEGATTDGHRFVPDAVVAGASAVCVNRWVGVGIPELVVPDTRAALGPLASLVHGSPSRDVQVIGVTGTNGKTTVTHYVESIGRSAGISTGLVGTVHTRYAGREIVSERTTPDASDFQRLLADMRAAGVSLVAAEVSSHALALHRVAGTTFAVAAFTNFSQDHLDFHGDMGSYLAAKRKLFDEYDVTTAVINIDDAAGAEIAADYSGSLVTVGARGEVRHEKRSIHRNRTTLDLVTPWGSARLDIPILGSFNVDNAVLAAACALAADIPFEDTTAGLQALPQVPGRFEVVSGDDPVTVIVDYAHTPKGITEAIAAARGITTGRVVALVGAGGERDREKRPLMGQALSGADVAVVTSDNPRSEDPEKIIGAVAEGLTDEARSMMMVNRREAIALALETAEAGDAVLILGRGHEPFQEASGQKVPFDDRQVAREALARLRKSANSGTGWGSMGR